MPTEDEQEADVLPEDRFSGPVTVFHKRGDEQAEAVIAGLRGFAVGDRVRVTNARSHFYRKIGVVRRVQPGRRALHLIFGKHPLRFVFGTDEVEYAD